MRPFSLDISKCFICSLTIVGWFSGIMLFFPHPFVSIMCLCRFYYLRSMHDKAVQFGDIKISYCAVIIIGCLSEYNVVSSFIHLLVCAYTTAFLRTLKKLVDS